MCRVGNLEFRVQDLGFRVQGVGFRSLGLLFGLRVSGLGFRVWGLGFRAKDLGFRVEGLRVRVWGSGFRVQGLGFRFQGLGFRVQGLGLTIERSRKCSTEGICPPPRPCVSEFGLFVAYSVHIVYRQVFQVPQFPQFEPSLEALSLRSDVISSVKILSFGGVRVQRPLVCTSLVCHDGSLGEFLN